MSVSFAPNGASGVVERVHHRGRRTTGAGLPRALGSEIRFRGRRLHMAANDVRELRRHGYEVVGHVGVQHLPLIVVDALFPKRRAESLHHTAANLLVDQERIDHGPAVLDAPVPQQGDEPGLGIDLQIGGLDAVGECEGVLARHVVPGRDELGLESVRQRVGR